MTRPRGGHIDFALTEYRLIAPAIPHQPSSPQQSSRRYRDDAPPAAAPPAIQLPQTLARPVFTDVSREALTAVAPQLVAVPTDFIRRYLHTNASQLQAGIAALAPSHLPQSIPTSDLPRTLTVPLLATSTAHPSYPTHVLAITAASSSNPRSEPARLFPVHDIVLAAHCTKLPPLTPAQPGLRSPANLPVLLFSLPSPQAFTILHPYMYTHRLDAALAALLPLPPAFLETLAPGLSGETPHAHVAAALSSRSALHTLAAHLVASAGGSLSALMTHAGHVKELWEDMVALGLYDTELWDALDLVWEVILGSHRSISSA
ncbi:hypothetical protein FB45DRAFT_755942 [Roridomyces roridus]|uniref:Clp1-like protein n=1 Tax=Roridomyces roridus TaxID=1738132 RepID=A0AAD7BEV3_9AGAR|nr:hypothetical protein FB45DRAFT_755942 [Roridomyces roridus]